jgi:hypothetical protein
MQTYPVDLDPAQIVRWAIAERKVTPTTLRMLARRTVETRDIPVRKEYHLGDEEREDLSEVATVATLEIMPIHPNDGWRLTIEVEDEAGPRLSGGTDVAIDVSIDPEAFYSEFLRRGRGIANVTAEVDNDAARARLTKLLTIIEKNRHAS